MVAPNHTGHTGGYASRLCGASALRLSGGFLLRGGASLVACLIGAAHAEAQPNEAARLQRVVSINMCADELALRLAQPGALASVTWLARDARSSNVSHLAHDLPVNYGAVEDVSAYRPDLVLAGRYTTRNTVSLLKRLNVPVIEIDVPSTLDGVRDQIADVAAMLGNEPAGAQLIADFNAELPGQLSAGAERPTAIVLRAAGFTTGKGSLVNDILNHAGIRNLAADSPLAGYAQPPLEMVVRAQPDILIINSDDETPASLAHEVLKHPALQQMGDKTRLVVLPTRLWTCAGPGVAEAVSRLAKVADAWRAQRRPSDARLSKVGRQ